MNPIESTWKTPENLSLYVREWIPDRDPQAVIVFVHGLGEHIGRYERWVNCFTQNRFVFLSFDLPGHGQSAGKRGHASYAAIMADIRHFLEEAALKYPGLPLFLYGHSLGGALVLYYGFTQSVEIAGRKLKGIIATSPGLLPAKPVPLAQMLLAKIMARIAPSFTMDNGLDRSGLSRVQEVIERYNLDPLVHGQISARLGLDLIENGKWMLTQKSFPVPLLLLQGSADRIVNPAGSKQLAENLGMGSSYHCYEGCYHELHNDSDWEEKSGLLVSWMQKLIG